ncbi:hypothetical protein NEFER03_1724 [Nematocida sp. LUAm3]|nr:hypothetical protein NEFER03_1724 [Nematocida sp. LUAm3]KAI5175714.1 hypothetical protein NEFER02_1601 [Nematocida sp. LUAm2]KAI5178620.1 hypothetical protein NEFER01_1756 [Nematocida sp. LUAm1]
MQQTEATETHSSYIAVTKTDLYVHMSTHTDTVTFVQEKETYSRNHKNEIAYSNSTQQLFAAQDVQDVDQILKLQKVQKVAGNILYDVIDLDTIINVEEQRVEAFNIEEHHVEIIDTIEEHVETLNTIEEHIEIIDIEDHHVEILNTPERYIETFNTAEQQVRINIENQSSRPLLTETSTYEDAWPTTQACREYWNNRVKDNNNGYLRRQIEKEERNGQSQYLSLAGLLLIYLYLGLMPLFMQPLKTFNVQLLLYIASKLFLTNPEYAYLFIFNAILSIASCITTGTWLFRKKHVENELNYNRVYPFIPGIFLTAAALYTAVIAILGTYIIGNSLYKPEFGLFKWMSIIYSPTYAFSIFLYFLFILILYIYYFTIRKPNAKLTVISGMAIFMYIVGCVISIPIIEHFSKTEIIIHHPNIASRIMTPFLYVLPLVILYGVLFCFSRKTNNYRKGLNKKVLFAIFISIVLIWFGFSFSVAELPKTKVIVPVS